MFKLLKTHPKFKVGAVVSLRSGCDRPMTVTYIGPVVFATGNWTICQWFSRNGDLEQEMFHEATLQLAEEETVA
jgi:uncharacterized protein YodC (DUF2158 family)